MLTRSRGSFDEILAGSDLVVEVMGGLDPARGYVLRAMAAGKHVVTANKQLLSQHGEELWAAARSHGVQLRFEAAVAGVVPVIRVLQESLAAAHVDRLHGIVNGTTNFILSRMADTGASYEDALAEAQALGYAEADPTEDVNGKDAAAKMAILARLAFNTPVHLDQVALRGHRGHHGRRHGVRARPRARSEADRDRRAGRRRPERARAPRLPLRRAPAGQRQRALQRGDHRVAGNHRDHAERPGAGGPQTASAVLGDVISDDPARLDARDDDRLEIVTDVESAFYLHLEVADRPGVLAQVAQLLGLQGASIRSFVQKGLGENARLVMVTHPLLESKFYAALELIGGLDFMRSRPRAIRVIDESSCRPMAGLIERYRDRLPFAPDDPVVSLQEGSTPLVPAPRLSDRVGAEVWLKLEGTNPTGSFKDRGMTCAVSDAVRSGAEMVICASTGNTAASLAAYAARAGIGGAVIVPEGMIAAASWRRRSCTARTWWRCAATSTRR